MVDVLKCFLTSRSHYTSLGSRFSPPASTSLGVPQRTITGPIFLNYAINNTIRCQFLMSPSTRITVHADDNTLLIGGAYTDEDSILYINLVTPPAPRTSLSTLTKAPKSCWILVNLTFHLSLASTESLLLNYLASYSTKS